MFRPTARAIRVQRSSCPRQCLQQKGIPHSLGRRFNSSGTPSDSYDRIFATLRPDMRDGDLAKTLAALFISSKNDPQKLLKTESTLMHYIETYRKAGLHRSVEEHLKNSSEEKYQSLVLSLKNRPQNGASSPESSWLHTTLPTTQLSAETEKNQSLEQKSSAPASPQQTNNPFPDLMIPDPILDPRHVMEFPPGPGNPYHNRVIVRNHKSVFHDYSESPLAEEEDNSEDQADTDEFLRKLPVSKEYYSNLNQSVLMKRKVVQQTGKGKIWRTAYMVLVGDGNGLVGYGEGKHANGATALSLARIEAVKNMDWVERFEQRTVWTEIETKLGATKLILRPRPVGFGLRCNPFLHQILRAAGFKDISAKVWGSRNKLNVIKAAFRMLQAGHAPTGMGDGIGGRGQKLSRGTGMRGKGDLERARGRKLISLRK